MVAERPSDHRMSIYAHLANVQLSVHRRINVGRDLILNNPRVRLRLRSGGGSGPLPLVEHVGVQQPEEAAAEPRQQGRSEQALHRDRSVTCLQG